MTAVTGAAAAVAASIEEALGIRRPVTSGTPADGGSPSLQGSWRSAGRPGEVCATDRRSWHQVDGERVLEAAALHLDRADWRLDVPVGGLKRLAAARGGIRVQCVVAERTGLVTLVVTSEPLVVGVETARELVRGHLRVVEE